MSWNDPRVLSFDPDTGIRELFYYDPDRDRFRIEAIQDVDDITDLNKAQHNEATDRGWKGDLNHVARIPLVLFYKLKKLGILNDQRAIKRWLNDKDNSVFRTRPGRV
jgi:hypothetical protein